MSFKVNYDAMFNENTKTIFTNNLREMQEEGLLRQSGGVGIISDRDRIGTDAKWARENTDRNIANLKFELRHVLEMAATMEDKINVLEKRMAMVNTLIPGLMGIDE